VVNANHGRSLDRLWKKGVRSVVLHSTLPTFKLEPLRASRSIIYRGEKRALIILHTRKSTELAREPRRSMCAATVTARSRRSPVCTYGRGGAPGIPRPCARAAIPTLGEFGPPPRARVYNLTLRKKLFSQLNLWENHFLF
jgi:hypothetical protein